MRAELHDSPKVRKLARLTGSDRFAVVGRLHRLWCWLDQTSETGQDVNAEDIDVDELVGLDGFADALRSIGWLTGDDGKLSFTNYEEHNGKNEKRRVSDARRKAEQRYNKRADCPQGVPVVSAKCPQSVRKRAPQEQEQEREQEQELNTPPITQTPAQAIPQSGGGGGYDPEILPNGLEETQSIDLGPARIAPNPVHGERRDDTHLDPESQQKPTTGPPEDIGVYAVKMGKVYQRAIGNAHFRDFAQQSQIVAKREGWSLAAAASWIVDIAGIHWAVASEWVDDPKTDRGVKTLRNWLREECYNSPAEVVFAHLKPEQTGDEKRAAAVDKEEQETIARLEARAKERATR